MEVSSEKVTLCGKLPQGILFLKNYDFWNLETCPFWKSVQFLVFGHFPDDADADADDGAPTIFPSGQTPSP